MYFNLAVVTKCNRVEGTLSNRDDSQSAHISRCDISMGVNFYLMISLHPKFPLPEIHFGGRGLIIYKSYLPSQFLIGKIALFIYTCSKDFCAFFGLELWSHCCADAAFAAGAGSTASAGLRKALHSMLINCA